MNSNEKIYLINTIQKILATVHTPQDVQRAMEEIRKFIYGLN